MGGGDIRRTPIQISGPRWPGVQQTEAWVKRQQEKTGEKEGDTQLAAPGTQEKQKRKENAVFITSLQIDVFSLAGQHEL